MKLLDKIKKAGLVGRGGAGFPTHLKWEGVRKAKADRKYVICNASEGELGLFKDFYILKNHADRVFLGLKLAMDFIGTKKAFFNLNGDYYKKIKVQIDELVEEYKERGYQISIFKEHPSYIGGEETALLNAIEGKRIEPRLKPPYPSDKGLFGKPTLIHNVETLYNVADVAEGKFEEKRFYCLSFPHKKGEVYQLPANWSIKKVLEKTKNIPDFPYFVQIGGSASGLVLNSSQLEKYKMMGAGSIEIYKANINPRDLLLKWFSFYDQESCGKCTPCREGTFQLHKLVKESKTIPWKKMKPILEVLGETSFCALGKSVSVPVHSYLKNVLKKKL